MPKPLYPKKVVVTCGNCTETFSPAIDLRDLERGEEYKLSPLYKGDCPKCRTRVRIRIHL